MDRVSYEKERMESDEFFFSLLCNGILNVCQVIRDTKGRLHSIPILESDNHESLLFSEIIADLSLVGVIS